MVWTVRPTVLLEVLSHMLISLARDPILAGVVKACAFGAALQVVILPLLENWSGHIDYIIPWE